MEVAGLVIGTVALTALFDNVITNLERIRVGREFGQNYESYVLQLDVLKLRLHRWHDAVSKLREAGGQGLESVNQADGELAKRQLEFIQELLDREEKLSQRYDQSTVTVTDTSSAEEEHKRWLIQSVRRVTKRHRRRRLPSSTTVDASNTNSSVGQRIDSPGFGNRAYWAIFGEKRFGELVVKIATHVTDLEHIISTQDMAEQLRRMRLEDAQEVAAQPEANTRDFDLLREIAGIIDQKFAEVVQEKPVREFIGNRVEGRGRIMQGDAVASGYSGPTISSSGSWRDNVAKDDGRIIQGTVYGHNPFE